MNMNGEGCAIGMEGAQPLVRHYEAQIAALQGRNQILEANQQGFIVINSHVLLELSCRSCKNFFGGRVYMCAQGHNICSGCHEHLPRCPVCSDAGPRAHNIFLERLSNKAMFSCSNSQQGCPAYFLPNNLADQYGHEMQCAYRFECKFFLPIDGNFEMTCKWKGRACDILMHCSEFHPAAIVRGAREFFFRIQLATNVGSPLYFTPFLVLSTDNEMFIIRFLYRRVPGLLVPHAFYMGRDEDLHRFRISYRFAGKNDVIFTGIPFGCHQNIDIDTLLTTLPHLTQGLLDANADYGGINCHVTIQRG